MSVSQSPVEKELLGLQAGLDERVKARIGSVRFEKLEKYITKKEKALEKDKLPADKLGLYIDTLFTSIKDTKVLEAICDITETEIAKQGVKLVDQFNEAIDQIPDKAEQQKLRKRLDEIEGNDFAGDDAITFLDDLKKGVTKQLSATLKETNIADKVDALCQYILETKPLKAKIEKTKVKIAKQPKIPETKKKRGPKAKPEPEPEPQPQKTQEELKEEGRRKVQEESIKQGRTTREEVDAFNLAKEKEKRQKAETEARKATEAQEAQKKSQQADTEIREKFNDLKRSTNINIETDLSKFDKTQLQSAKKEFFDFRTKHPKKIPLAILSELGDIQDAIQTELESRPKSLKPTDIKITSKIKSKITGKSKLIDIDRSTLGSFSKGPKAIKQRIDNLETCPVDFDKKNFFRILNSANLSTKSKPVAVRNVYDTFLTTDTLTSISDVVFQATGLIKYVELDDWNAVWTTYGGKQLRIILQKLADKCGGK